MARIVTQQKTGDLKRQRVGAETKDARARVTFMLPRSACEKLVDPVDVGNIDEVSFADAERIIAEGQ